MNVFRGLGAAGAVFGLATLAGAQCVDMCTVTAFGNQNGIRMHRGLGVTSTDFPNLATGNVMGDALWKVYPCSVLSNAAGTMTLTGVELPLQAGAFTTGVVNIPDFEIRRAVVGMSGCLEPDFAAMPIATFTLGTIALPSAGAFRINVSLGGTGTPIPNGDVAIVYLATPGETSATPDHARAYRTTAETNPTLCGYSGSFDAMTATVTPFPPTDEVRFELAFLEPVIQAFGGEAVLPATQRTGTGGYFPTAGSTVGWRIESFDAWNKGQLGLVVLSATGGVCPGACTLPDPFGGPACASLTFDFMTTIGLSLPGIFGPFTLTDTAAGCPAGAPFMDGTKDTPGYPVPPGVAGFTLYGAGATLCLTPAPGASPVVEMTNTIEMVFM